MSLTATFSIVARCTSTGEVGTAVASAVPAVGAICSFVSQHGAISTQSFNNYYFGLDGLRFLAEGCEPAVVRDLLLQGDPGRELRQLLIIDHQGEPCAFTGSDCVSMKGERIGAHYAIAGNMLSSEAVLDAMERVFEGHADIALSERFMRALEAGERAGGDRRGKQSAALKIISRASAIPICDLRVDEHREPVAELRRVLEVARVQLFGFLRSMPTRRNPAGSLSKELTGYLSRHVDER